MRVIYDEETKNFLLYFDKFLSLSVAFRIFLRLYRLMYLFFISLIYYNLAGRAEWNYHKKDVCTTFFSPHSLSLPFSQRILRHWVWLFWYWREFICGRDCKFPSIHQAPERRLNFFYFLPSFGILIKIFTLTLYNFLENFVTI